jgi:hypothetical protein
MGLWELAFAIFGGLILYCLVLPAAGGILLYKGLKQAAVEQPFNLCAKVAFASTYMSFFLVLVLGSYLLPDSKPLEGRLIWAAVMLSLQVVLVVVLMRNYSPKALAIEIAIFVVLNAFVFGINLLLNPVRTIPVVD